MPGFLDRVGKACRVHRLNVVSSSTSSLPVHARSRSSRSSAREGVQYAGWRIPCRPVGAEVAAGVGVGGRCQGTAHDARKPRPSSRARAAVRLGAERSRGGGRSSASCAHRPERWRGESKTLLGQREETAQQAAVKGSRSKPAGVVVFAGQVRCRGVGSPWTVESPAGAHEVTVGVSSIGPGRPDPVLDAPIAEDAAATSAAGPARRGSPPPVCWTRQAALPGRELALVDRAWTPGGGRRGDGNRRSNGMRSLGFSTTSRASSAGTPTNGHADKDAPAAATSTADGVGDLGLALRWSLRNPGGDGVGRAAAVRHRARSGRTISAAAVGWAA